VADVQHFNPLLSLQDAVYHTIDVGPVAVQQVPELVLLGRRRAAVWLLFQAENGVFEPPVPFQGRAGMPASISSYRRARSRSARAAMLTRYAMPGFEVVEELPDRPHPSLFRVLQAWRMPSGASEPAALSSKR